MDLPVTSSHYTKAPDPSEARYGDDSKALFGGTELSLNETAGSSWFGGNLGHLLAALLKGN